MSFSIHRRYAPPRKFDSLLSSTVGDTPEVRFQPAFVLDAHLTISHRATGGGSMPDPQCACGALRLALSGPPRLTAVCHCFACQRRTGAPFSANAFYPIDGVQITGASTEFIRTAESGRKVRMHFCPTCGSTVYWKPDASPFMIGVAVGSLAEPSFAPPDMSLFEQSKHKWVQLEGTAKHFQRMPPDEHSHESTRA